MESLGGGAIVEGVFYRRRFTREKRDFSATKFTFTVKCTK